MTALLCHACRDFVVTCTSEHTIACTRVYCHCGCTARCLQAVQPSKLWSTHSMHVSHSPIAFLLKKNCIFCIDCISCCSLPLSLAFQLCGLFAFWVTLCQQCHSCSAKETHYWPPLSCMGLREDECDRLREGSRDLLRAGDGLRFLVLGEGLRRRSLHVDHHLGIAWSITALSFVCQRASAP